MKIRNVILLVLLAFVITVVLRFPASVVLANVETAPAVVHSPSGTIWRGAARAVSVGANRVQDVGWQVNPLLLFSGRVGANIDFSIFGGDGIATVARSLGGDMLVTDGALTLNAATLAKMIPGDLVDLSGDVDLAVEDWLFVNQQPERLRGDIIWRNAALKSPAQAELGTVTVTITPNNDGHTAELTNNGGQVQITGKVDVNKRGTYRADVRLKPRANAPADLDGTLGLLGRKGGDGSYRLRQNGRLSDLF
ncbi:MAG: type II secretion system protein N [Pseudomonadota bacterium]